MRELSSNEISMVSGAGKTTKGLIAEALGKLTLRRENNQSIRTVAGRLSNITRRFRRELGLRN